MAIKEEIDKLAAAEPRTIWDKVIISTPVIMTVVATILAGLSSSEMSQAQYHRSVAAQQQSKASDQWNLFQGKRQRATSASYFASLLGATSGAGAFSLDALQKLSPATQPGNLAEAANALNNPHFPAVRPIFAEPKIEAAYKAFENDVAESVPTATFANIDLKILNAEIRKSLEHTKAAEDAVDPTAKGIAQISQLVRSVNGKPEAKPIVADFTAAQLRFDDAREKYEAKLNQVTAYLYEISVRKSTLDSERHQTRSRYFFFGMLAAQAAVTLATIALAAKVRSTLWILAASIGVIAVAYAGYVYLYT